MVSDKFSDLIKFLVGCNGTGMAELEKRVRAGELTEDEAAVVATKVKLFRLEARLTALDDRISQPS